jgi:4-amino-4-deoxy-L-arabinose transferase-like glycosyltransferase
MLLFRLLVAVAPSTVGMRLYAAVYAGMSATVLAYVGTRLWGRWAGLCAALLYAVFASGPQNEGFIVDGELLATLPTVAAVALLLSAHRQPRAGGRLFLAGLAAGTALLVKQSAHDGAAVVLLFALAAGPHGARVRRAALVLAGIVAALALAALHGALTGWQAYVDAVVLDNLRYRGFDASANTFANAVTAFRQFASEDGALLVATLIAVIDGAVRARRAPLTWLPVVWLAVATWAVTLGGLYNRHYFVQMLPPLCVLAGAGLVRTVQALRRAPAAALLLLPLLAALGVAVATDAPYYVGSSPIAISRRLYGWTVYTEQATLVRLLRQRVPPGQPFFVAYAAAPLHYLSGRPSVTPYLWRRPLGTIPGAYTAALRAVQRGQPVCVVTVQPVSVAPGDVRMRRAITLRYTAVWSRPGVHVYCRPARS